jgi:hypothetical protein
VARALEGEREHALVLGAGARLASRLDLGAIADVASQLRGLFVVDVVDLVDAEGADTPSAKPATTATTTASRSLTSVTTTV